MTRHPASPAPLPGQQFLPLLEQEEYREHRGRLLQLADEGDPLAQAVVALQEPSPAGAAERIATLDAQIAAIPDPDLRAFSLSNAIGFAEPAWSIPQIRHWSEEALDRLRLLAPQLRREQARRLHLLAAINLAEAEGNRALTALRVAEALAVFPPGSHTHSSLQTRQWMPHAIRGELLLLDPGLRQGPAAEAPLRARWIVSAFINAVEVGDVDLARSIEPELEQAALQWPSHAVMARWYRCFLDVVDAALSRRDVQGLEERLEAMAEGPPRPAAGLARHFASDVRDLADQVAGRPASTPPASSDEDRARTASCLVACLPLRAALDGRDAATARRLLLLRRSLGNPCYLDRLFWARCLALEGDLVGAQHQFGECWQQAEAIGALGRVEFELRCARDLDAFAAARLARGPAEERAARTVPAPPAPARSSTHDRHRLVGDSLATITLRDLIRRMAPSQLPVLVTGPTGSGKDLVVRSLHAASPRAKGALVSLNCSGMSESLLESELFGHTRGAFSGAERERSGLVTEARGGFLFLDEIGDASAHFQALLLRLLENGEYRAVGSNQVLHADCRIVAATNVDLEAEVSAGRFRRDLWYRLRRLELVLPPLDQRRDDIIPIAMHLLDPGGIGTPRLSDDLARHLRQRSWPGNVRQLRNELERMLVLVPERQAYGLEDFRQIEADSGAKPPAHGGGTPPDVEPGEPLGPQGLRRLDQLHALFRRHQRMSRADVCRLLGISPTTATADLRALCEAGLVRKITPTRSPATHYFIVADPSRP